MSSNLTLVTALFDLGRGDLESGFKRSFDHYVESFTKLLKVDYPMVIYCEPSLEEVIWQHRSRENTRLVFKSLDDLREFPFYKDIQDIRVDPKWYGQSGWIVDSTQAKLELYNPLVMSKQFYLNDATHFNFFDTKYYLWIDAGIANTIGDPAGYIDKEFERRITPDLNKMLYVAFPYDGTVEVHGFEKTAMDRMAGKETQFVCRGGIFGGPKHAINEINDIYYGLMSESFGNRLMGTEESIFTIIAYKYPNKVNVRMIENNGLVYKYFQDLKDKPVMDVEEELAFYVLTYNLPQQFELWAKSMSETFPKEFKEVRKYVIDNSTDPRVADRYQELFTQYGFEVFKKDNIGINGGRQFAAEHFLASKHEYMVFFEDDMLFHAPGAGLCKSGFSTYHNDLFDKCLDIMKSEKLDYLKLAFSEFYGDNHKNWAWENLPLSKKSEYFPDREDGTEVWKVKIDYTGTHKGLPYAVGEYHYCNWPIMFTKKGTQVVFMEVRYAGLYEQTWMSQTMMHMRDGKLKVGSLLATPINHNRVYHYDGSTRRENDLYTN
ncbi:hypothetical protein Xoosp13_300 [Xanthomonas phage Xoo-sp13]|nr:hypothetical protein Xoosp13_300 [Xanthomonas phage Xoo-sp13]